MWDFDNSHFHRTALSELDAIAQQIEKNLLESIRVTNDCNTRWNIGKDTMEFKAFLIRLNRHHTSDGVNKFGNTEWHRFDLHTSCFDLAKVQDVIYQCQQ